MLSELPATLLSAWESSDGVLYAVGGTATRAMVLRHDRDGWWEMDPGTTDTLWWVHGFSAMDVYAVGARGVVTHFDGTRWTVLREGGDETLFGAWGATKDQLVAVGGVVTVSQPRATIVERSAGWNEVPTGGLPSGVALFKLWGRSPNELVVVGEKGLVARGLPGAWTVEATPTTERLTTVHGAGDALYAVGGLLEPVALRFVNGAWRRFAVPGTPQLLNGVAVSATGEAVLVGLEGYLAEGAVESFVMRAPLTRRGLHGVVATRSGFVAVGGDLLGSFGHGVVLARGDALAGSSIQRWPWAGVPLDGGVEPEDAGADAGTDGGPPEPPDGGWLSPGASCDERPGDCDPRLNLSCWFVFGPYKSYCGAACTDVSECGAYGAGACCKLPGPQVTQTVCLPEIACDAGT
ncbi:MAG: hypothetical protein ACOZQL_14930 [Myxococcota bacterium]